MRPVARFAAHLAHLLNAGSAEVQVSPFALYRRLLRTLVGPEYGSLIGIGVLGAQRGVDEVAQKYFDDVLNRRLRLARADHTHKGHALFLALCRRGLGPVWPAARLERANAVGPGQTTQVPADFAGVADRLARVDKSVGPGNPAGSTRARHGPLSLEVGVGRAEVAEELSLWDAITCAPAQLRPLARGHEFNAFCSLVIRAVEAANDPYGAYITLGLSPFDWAESLSVNTAGKLSAFRSEVYKEGGAAAWTGDPEAWRRAWTRRQVPGYPSADELWHSELGRTVRLPRISRRCDTDRIDELPAGDTVSPEPEVQNETEFRRHLALCREGGIVDDFDVWLCGEVWAGRTIDELARTPQGRRRFTGSAGLAAYLEELTGRVVAWVRGFLDGDDSDPEASR